MARSKAALDPVQAARKAAQGREAKRNKERKDQAHEARTLRQDTSSLERQVSRLEARLSQLSEDEQKHLANIKIELGRVQRIKQDYVTKNPDQRNFVRGFEAKAVPKPQPKQPVVTAATSLYTQARDPRWSLYYDAVFNPYGAPPPGMPYLEKSHEQLLSEGIISSIVPHQPPLPDESEESSDEDRRSNSDVDAEDIELPQGSPPNSMDVPSDDESEDSSVDEELKDIIMPQGPPPSQNPAQTPAVLSPTRPLVPLPAGEHHHIRGVRGGSTGQGPSRGRQRGRGRPSEHITRPPANAPPTRAQVTASSSSAGPGTLASRPPSSDTHAAVITAAPQLRDLRQEATVFMPTSIRKKQSEAKGVIK